VRQWRLIYDQPTLGALNMARDEAILAAVSSGVVPPTLRLYAWNPPCLSLGYGQRAREADLDRLAERGWQIVRRPTGGRAILHTDELTYSLALPIDDPLAQANLVESYRQISTALLIALGNLGAQAQANRAEGNMTQVTNPICFETPSHYEITVEGRKLVGSAQVRRKHGILQHGTLPLSGDISRICNALVYSDEAARTAAKADVHARALTLEEALGVALDWETVANSVVESFAQGFDLTLIPAALTPTELDHAQRLTAEVYANPDWTFRR